MPYSVTAKNEAARVTVLGLWLGLGLGGGGASTFYSSPRSVQRRKPHPLRISSS